MFLIHLKSNMRKPTSLGNLLFTLLMLFCIGASAQNAEPFSCFNAQEIKFPLSANDFSKNEILMNDSKLNALYYLYQDKYSFWYKFVAEEDIEIQFSVSPSNPEDRYRAVAFKYGKNDFCEKLVNEGIHPLSLEREAIFSKDRLIYKNVIKAAAGDTFYISVLSLNTEDCGHFLYMEANEAQLSMHAVHRPCYNFQYLEVPDFTTSRKEIEDVDLEMEFGFSEPDEVVEDPEPFAAITSIEVQQKEEGVVSVGDKLVLNKVFFYNNTYALKPGADVELNQLLIFLQVNESIEVEIQGHSANNTALIEPDPNFKGQGKEWNFKGSAFELSEMRARAVRDFLIENGIDKKRLGANGFGDTQKRVPNAETFEDSEKNMRVEALIISQ